MANLVNLAVSRIKNVANKIGASAPGRFTSAAVNAIGVPDVAKGFTAAVSGFKVNPAAGRYAQSQAAISLKKQQDIRKAQETGRFGLAKQLMAQPDLARSRNIGLQRSMATARDEKNILGVPVPAAARKSFGGGAKSLLSAYGLGAGLPTVLGSTAISTGLGAGISALTGEDIATGAGHGFGSGPQFAGLNRATAPFIDPLVQYAGAGKPLVAKLTARALMHGGLNVLEDNAYTGLTETRPSTIDENIFSFLVGAAVSPMIKYRPNDSFFKIVDDGNKLKINRTYFKTNVKKFAEELGISKTKLSKQIKDFTGWYNEPIRVRDMDGNITYVPRGKAGFAGFGVEEPKVTKGSLYDTKGEFPLKIREGSYGVSKYPELSDQKLVDFAKKNNIVVKKTGSNVYELISPTGKKIEAFGREVFDHLEEMYKRTPNVAQLPKAKGGLYDMAKTPKPKAKQIGQYKLDENEFFSDIKIVKPEELTGRQYFVDNKIVEQKIADIKAGKKIDPVIVKEGEVIDGYHTAEAFTKLGYKEIPTISVENTLDVAQLPLSDATKLRAKPPEVTSVTAQPTKITTTKIRKRELQAQARTIKQEYDSWKRELYKQEGGVSTIKGNLNRQIKEVTESIRGETKPAGTDIKNMKDITGFMGQARDVYRNFKAVYGKRFGEVKKVLLDPFDRSKGEFANSLVTWKNRINDEVVKKLGIKSSKMSADVQLFGEGKITQAELVTKYGDEKALNIIQADKWFRAEYDKLLREVNEVRGKIYPGQADKQIPRRQDYYRHFREMAQGIKGLINIFDSPAQIKSALSGVSEFTKPKSKWLSFAQRRLGADTDVDAIRGFLDYVTSAEYAKNIDPHTAKFRALANDLVAVTEMGTENAGKVNNFIEYLHDFSGDLAGKTNPADRFFQKVIPGGRKTFMAINWLNNRVKANVILGNISSSIAQIFNVPQGIAEAGPVASVRGLGRSIATIFGDARPIKQSDFMAERYAYDVFSSFDKGMVQNAKKMAVWITSVLDKVGTRYIWNSTYEKALMQGIENPIKYADDITRNMVAGRGIGEVPLLQKSKIFQLVAPFQLEVANVWHVMKDWVSEKQFGKLVAFFGVSYLFNKGAKKIRGSDVSFDPIDASIDAYNTFKEEEDKKIGALRAGGRLSGEVLSNFPIGQSLAAMYPEYGVKVGGENITREELFGEGDPTRYGSGLLLTKGIQDPLYKLLPPFGGQQLKRSKEGVEAQERGYSETKTGRARFPIPSDTLTKVKTAVFGEYSTPEAQEYFEKKRTPLGEKQTETFKSVGNKYYESVMKKRELEKEKKKIIEKAKKELEAKDSSVKEAHAAEVSKEEKDIAIEIFKLSDEQKTEINGVLYYKTDEDTVKSVGIDWKEPTLPEVESDEPWDDVWVKAKISDYKSGISKRQKDVMQLYELGEMSYEKAYNEYLRLDELKKTATNKVTKPKKPKKVTIPKVSLPKTTKLKSAKIKRVSLREKPMRKAKFRSKL